MPIYEYACNGCGHQFEEWQKISDSPVRKCPSCGKRKVERLVSLSSFHLKGSGWYVTDYGGKKSGTAPDTKTAEEKTADAPAKKAKDTKKTNKAKGKKKS